MKTSGEMEAAKPAESFHGSWGRGGSLLLVAEPGLAWWHRFGKAQEPLNDRQGAEGF